LLIFIQYQTKIEELKENYRYEKIEIYLESNYNSYYLLDARCICCL